MVLNAPDGTEVGTTFSPLGDARSRSDLIVESIRAAILGGKLAAGELLVERRLADELQVSKTPVREALIVLARSGLVEVARNRGSAVRLLTLPEVRQIYEMRALLEPWAVASAIGNPAADFAQAERALDEAAGFERVGDVGNHALANRRFHRAMYQDCENEFIVDALDGLQDLTALATVSVLWENWPTWRDESTEHRAILEAARAGEPQEASNLVRAHIERTVERIRERSALR